MHRALSSIILHVRSSASKERPWGAIFDAVKALLASPLPLFSRPLQLALGEACVVAAEAGGPSCAAALVAHLLALLPARSASNNPFALRAAAKPGGDGDGPASARAAALHVLGDLFTAFGSALAPQLGEAAPLLQRLSAPGGGGEGAPAAVALRAAAATALYRCVEGAGPRAAPAALYAALLAHAAGATGCDPAPAVRACVGPQLAAVAACGGASAGAPLGAALSAASAGLGDPHGAVRMGAALALAALLASSAAATARGAAAGDAAAVGAVLGARGGGGGALGGAGGGDGEGAAAGGGGGGGSGGEEGGGDFGAVGGGSEDEEEEEGEREGGEGGGGRVGGGADAGGDAGGNGSAAPGGAGGGGGGGGGARMGDFFARFKFANGFQRRGGDSPPRAPVAMTADAARALSASVSQLASPTDPRGGMAGALAGLRRASRGGVVGAGGGSGGAPLSGGFTLPTALAYLGAQLRGCAALAARGGVRAADVRAAVAVAAGALLRSTRGGCGGGGLSGGAPLREALRAWLAPLGGGGSAGGDADSPPKGGPHAVHARAAALHALWVGLAAPPTAPRAAVPARWAGWLAALRAAALALLAEATGAREGECAGALPAPVALLLGGGGSGGAARGAAADAQQPAQQPQPPPSRFSFRVSPTAAKLLKGLGIRSGDAAGGGGGDVPPPEPAPGAPREPPLPAASAAVLLQLLAALLPGAGAGAAEPVLAAALRALAAERPSAALRGSALGALRAAVAAAPALAPRAFAACLAAAAEAGAAAASGPSRAAVAGAAIAGALADAAALGAVRRAAAAAARGESSAPGGATPPPAHTLTHSGGSAVEAAGGFGVPGAGAGSGAGVLTGAAAAHVWRLGSFAAAAAALLVAWRAGKGSGEEAPPLREAAKEALALATVLLAGADGAAGAAAPSAAAMVLPRQAVGGASVAAAAAAASNQLAAAASGAALAELRAALTRAGCALIAAAAPAAVAGGGDAWAAAHALLARALLHARREQEDAGIGNARSGTGAYTLCPMGVPPPVADATALLSTSGCDGDASEGASGSRGGERITQPPSDGEAGVALARTLYCGLAAAWSSAGTASVAGAVSALARAAGPFIESRPAALGQLVRLVRLGLLLLTEAPVIPAAARLGSGAALAGIMRGRAGEIFEDAGAATTLRAHAGAIVALGAAVRFSLNPFPSCPFPFFIYLHYFTLCRASRRLRGSR